jgi:hypothetical protein
MLERNMISENTVVNTQIIDAIILYHRKKIVPAGGLGIVLNGTILEIPYGYNNVQRGRIAMARGQFEITQVTNSLGNLVNLKSYNHVGSNKTKQKYIDALKDTNLNNSQERVSALIILTSESCRSQMVSSALTILLNNGPNFDDDVWAGLEFAFNNYGSTAKHMGFNIQAGGEPWSWLSSSNYLSYIQSDTFTGDKEVATARINAVKKYINPN